MSSVVIRLRGDAEGRDQYGDPVPAAEFRRRLPGAFVAPRGSDEGGDRGRTGVIVGLSLFSRAPLELVPSDRVEVDGIVYELEGETGEWRNPLTGRRAGYEASLRRAAG